MLAEYAETANHTTAKPTIDRTNKPLMFCRRYINHASFECDVKPTTDSNLATLTVSSTLATMSVSPSAVCAPLAQLDRATDYESIHAAFRKPLKPKATR